MNKEETQFVRPPVVAVMGHIDHGKSTLLDYIRKTNTCEKEAGGITQRMSAYKVERKNEKGECSSITFLDTPGHEAFGALRGRGARVADIAILVVAADEGVKPQTLDAFKCIKDAGLPFIVAINKIDRPNANIDKTKQNLAENEIFLEGWGGDVPFVPLSAITGEGVEDLLQMILLLSEITELKADLAIPAEGIVIQAENSKTKGISASFIVKNGTLKSGQFIVCEDTFSSTRMMEDFQGKKIEEGFPGDPVRVTGFSSLPPVGSIFKVVESKKDAEKEIEKNQKEDKQKSFISTVNESGLNFMIPIIIKASTTDVIEAIVHEIMKIKNDRVSVKIVSTGVGFISESDVKMALGSQNAVVLGFDTSIDNSAKALSERANIPVQTFNIIYKLAEWLENYMKEKTPKIKMEELRGKAKVLKFFSKDKDKQVIGCRVEEGAISLGDEIRIIRRDTEIGRGKIKILQQMKSDVKEVKEGLECGVCVEAKHEVAPGDFLESYAMVEK